MSWLERISLNWSPPLPIEAEWEFGLKLPPGVYRLVADDRIIHRVCGEDSSGTLYIGMSANTLDGRVCELRKALNRKKYSSKNHKAGTLYRDTEPLTQKFPLEILRTTWATTIGAGPRQLEADIIAAYVSEFGEPPPLNGQHGARDC